MFKDKINTILNNKDGKVLISNFGYLSLLQIAGYIFPIITMPYLARIIGAEGFGRIAFASGIIVWMQTISDWGFNYTATRDVARNRENKEKVSKIFSNVLWSRCILMLVSLLLLLIFVMFIPKLRENIVIIMISFLIIPGQIMFPDWFFQAMEKMKYITFLNLLSKAIFTIAIFVFIRDKNDFIFQPLFLSLGFLTAGIISMYYILIRWRVKLYRPNIKTITATIKSSTDIFINNLMPSLYKSFSTILLGFFCGNIANGKLDAGGKFVDISDQFMKIISRTFYPFLSRRIDKHALYTKVNIYLSLIISFILFIIAPILIHIFFTKEFYNSIIILRIMSISIFFLALSNIYGTNFMIIKGYEKELRNVTAISSCVGFVLSFPLIYYFNYIGAAINITLTRGILGVSIMLRAKKIKE